MQPMHAPVEMAAARLAAVAAEDSEEPDLVMCAVDAEFLLDVTSNQDIGDLGLDLDFDDCDVEPMYTHGIMSSRCRMPSLWHHAQQVQTAPACSRPAVEARVMSHEANVVQSYKWMAR